MKEEQHIQTDLSFITSAAAEKETENDQFASWLKQQDSHDIDERIRQLNEQVQPLIDCTQCGNCCRSLMINVTEAEAGIVSSYLKLPREAFDEQYLEKGSNGMMLINQIPCHFLTDNKCTIYEQRFAGCREFPGLHLAGFNKRLFTIFMHYGRCPIIFNVVEALKKELEFH